MYIGKIEKLNTKKNKLYAVSFLALENKSVKSDMLFATSDDMVLTEKGIRELRHRIKEITNSENVAILSLIELAG